LIRLSSFSSALLLSVVHEYLIILIPLITIRTFKIDILTYLEWHGIPDDEPCRVWWDEEPCAHGATGDIASTSCEAENA
jgi:hypothetical protein